MPRRSRLWARRLQRFGVITLVISLLVALSSQIHLPRTNPAFDMTNSDAAEVIAAMRGNPVGLERPVIVLSGYRSPRTNADFLREKIIELTGADPSMVVAMSYPLADDIEPIASHVVGVVDETWPSGDPSLTTEVDVVAISMGGLVARTAALPTDLRGADSGKRLNIRTLITFASPHRGARLSRFIRPDAAAGQMLAGSDFMSGLNDRFSDAEYELVPYAVLHDRWVGATNAAPPGSDPIWIRGRLAFSHHLMTYEPLLIADMARRLRGEPGLGSPSAPPVD